MDIFLSIIVGIVFFLPCLIVALLIKLETRGPVFADTPPRAGQKEKQFRLYKFRSMVVNAHQLIRTDPKLKKLYQEYKKGSYKLKDDPRVTRVGKFIRKHSIDEIPQLINVFRGEMSFVGPRPYYPDELEEQQKKYPETEKMVHDALEVKPGITGLWQVSGRSNVNFDKRIALDAYYARKKSIFLDLVILLKSPWAMISGKGAV